MKKLLLLLCFFSISNLGFSQTESSYKKNKYLITMYNLHDKNFDLTKSMLEKFTDATSIEFNKTDSSFVVLTYRTLNKKVVSGKMLKNYLPIKYFILEGEPIDPFPVLVNTGNAEEDGRVYDEQKTMWIQKYPAEYKKMIENLKKQ
jgi:hypothetical protein